MPCGPCKAATVIVCFLQTPALVSYTGTKSEPVAFVAVDMDVGRKSVDAEVAAVPKPRFVLAVEVFARSDRLFDESNAPLKDAYAATQDDPSYTFIESSVLLK
jgi:hypothetical protein